MSIQTGVPLNGLPPPTPPNIAQSYTDAWGEVWVSQYPAYSATIYVPGFLPYGGWRKARDVLHAVIYRNAAFTNGSASPGITVAYDTVLQDGYGMYVGSPTFGFQVPIGGWYWVQATANGNSTAVGTYIQGEIYRNSTQVTSNNHSSPLVGGGLSWSSYVDLYLAANDTITCKTYQNGTAAGLQTGPSNTRLEISYQGTG
jgi:hypothetical protein